MIRYIVRFWRAAVRHPRIAAQGYREGWSGFGLTFDDDPESPRSVAYDVGRTLRRRDP